jgi:hypothetical protein
MSFGLGVKNAASIPADACKAAEALARSGRKSRSREALNCTVAWRGLVAYR